MADGTERFLPLPGNNSLNYATPRANPVGTSSSPCTDNRAFCHLHRQRVAEFERVDLR